MSKNNKNKKGGKSKNKEDKAVKDIPKMTLADFGAHDCFNRLKPPQCACGLGGYGNIILKDDEDKDNFIYGVLEQEECEHAFVFILGITDVVFGFTGGIGEINGIEIYSMKNENNPDDFYGKVDAARSLISDVEPHCIGIIQYTGQGNAYRVVADAVYEEENQ